MSVDPSGSGMRAAEGFSVQTHDIADLRDLILAAFAKARASGRRDWSTMTVAVLKNRLLELTDRRFSESDYGARNISELVRGIPDLLDYDDSVKPPIVRLREPVKGENLEPASATRVRRDLWNSVIDYARGEPYVWAEGKAIPRSEVQGDAQFRTLPTLTRDEELSWRSEFVQQAESSGLAEKGKEQLRRWLQEHLSNRDLPEHLQRSWNSYLKARVVNRLRSWFSAQGVPEPEDFLLVVAPAKTVRPSSDLEELRAFVIRCVQRMTYEELSELRLPPQVMLRGRH